MTPIRLAARMSGEGPAVLLLHGLFGQGRNLAGLQTALAHRHRVAAFDLRNHGTSPHAPGMAYATLAEDVAYTVADTGLGPCAVIGHSMGGKVAMRLALAAPALVTRLLVADIAPATYPGTFAEYARAMQALPLTPGITRRQADAALAPAVPDAAVRAFLLQSFIPGQTPGWRIGLPDISAAIPDLLSWPTVDGQYDGPTRFVGGARSDYLRPHHHATIRALFPHAQFATIPDAGHWLHVDNPAGFLDQIRSFLADPPPRW